MLFFFSLQRYKSFSEKQNKKPQVVKYLLEKWVFLTMNKIQTIISEEVNKVLFEKKEAKTKKEKRYGLKKAKGGKREKYDLDKYKKENISISMSEQQQARINDILKSEFVNLAAVARELYPRLTSEGAQSKLRKKVYNEKSDSGTPYKLSRGEYKKLAKILSKYGYHL